MGGRRSRPDEVFIPQHHLIRLTLFGTFSSKEKAWVVGEADRMRCQHSPDEACNKPQSRSRHSRLVRQHQKVKKIPRDAPVSACPGESALYKFIYLSCHLSAGPEQ